MSSDRYANMPTRFSVQYWMALRQALLMELDALERELIDNGVRLEPRTAELRKWWKEHKREGAA